MKRSSVALSLLTAMLAAEASYSTQESQKPQRSKNPGKVELAEASDDEQLRITLDAKIKLGKELLE